MNTLPDLSQLTHEQLLEFTRLNRTRFVGDFLFKLSTAF